MNRRTSLALAASLLTAAAGLSIQGAIAQDATEQCYGIALAGQNDCAAVLIVARN